MYTKTLIAALMAATVFAAPQSSPTDSASQGEATEPASIYLISGNTTNTEDYFSVNAPDGTDIFSDIEAIDAASGRGHARLVNKCNDDLVFQRCYQQHGSHPPGCDPSQTGVFHLPKGHTYSQKYTKVLDDGISFKVRRHNGDFENKVLQLEYTHAKESDGTPYLSYDVSEVNGNPFGPEGFALRNSNPGCFSHDCHPPAKNCPTIFDPHQPTSGVPHKCGIGSDTAMVICSG